MRAVLPRLSSWRRSLDWLHPPRCAMARPIAYDEPGGRQDRPSRRDASSAPADPRSAPHELVHQAGKDVGSPPIPSQPAATDHSSAHGDSSQSVRQLQESSPTSWAGTVVAASAPLSLLLGDSQIIVLLHQTRTARLALTLQPY
eukprot:6203387-Pleurochrysis_carterae.AAC.2